MIPLQELSNLIRLSDPLLSDSRVSNSRLSGSGLSVGKTKSGNLKLTKLKLAGNQAIPEEIGSTTSKNQQKFVESSKKKSLPTQTNRNQAENQNDEKSIQYLQKTDSNLIQTDHLKTIDSRFDLSNLQNGGSSSKDRQTSKNQSQFTFSKESKTLVLSVQLPDALLIFRSKNTDFSIMSLEIHQNESKISFAELLTKLKKFGIDEIYRNGSMISGDRLA